MRFKSEQKHVLHEDAFLFNPSTSRAPDNFKVLFLVSVTVRGVEASCWVSGLARLCVIQRLMGSRLVGLGEASFPLEFLPCSDAIQISAQISTHSLSKSSDTCGTPGPRVGNAEN